MDMPRDMLIIVLVIGLNNIHTGRYMGHYWGGVVRPRADRTFWRGEFGLIKECEENGGGT